MTQKRRKIIEWTIISLLSIILVLSTVLLFYQKAYAGKMYWNVKIAGVDVSGKTKKQAEYMLRGKFNSISNKQVDFIANNKTISAKISEIGLTFDINSAISEAYVVGRSSMFINQLFHSASTVWSNIDIDVATSLDQSVYGEFLKNKVPDLNVAAKDAVIKIENGEVVIEKEATGQEIDVNDIKNQITALYRGDIEEHNKITINIKTTPVVPVVLSAPLDQLKSEVEEMSKKKITLTYADQKYYPSASQILLWINVSRGEDNKYRAVLDDTAVKSYLIGIAKNFEIETKDKKINAIDNKVIEEGSAGRYLDKNGALALIKKQFYNEASFTVALATYDDPPKEVKVFPAEGIVPGRFEGKYIDVDLTQQKLCLIEGKTLGECFIISSGKPSMPTPMGIRFILNKNPKQWSAKYGLWMPWWQSIGGSYGIHELPEWPNGYKEGESHLGTPVSHGCVRLGVGSAEYVYNWTAIGTPVYIHK